MNESNKKEKSKQKAPQLALFKLSEQIEKKNPNPFLAVTPLYLRRAQITAISKSLSPLQRLPPAAFPGGLDGVAVAWPGAVTTAVLRQDDLWACRKCVQGGWSFVCLLACSPIFLGEETSSKINLFWQKLAFGASLEFLFISDLNGRKCERAVKVLRNPLFPVSGIKWLEFDN